MNEKESTKQKISQLYRELLLREPDNFGLEYYVEQVLQKKLTINDVKKNILTSPEYDAINPKYDFTSDGSFLNGFFDEYLIFQKSSTVGSHINRLNGRYKAIIEKNAHILKDSTVLDLASHDGRWSFAALKSNAKYVLGIEGRDDLVLRAKDNFQSLSVESSKYDFKKGFLPSVLQDVEVGKFDVIFCLGFFYHTIEHWKTLSEIKRLKPKYLILDTNISISNDSIIELELENALDEGRGISLSTNSVLVGKPSKSALDLMLQNLNFSVEYIDWKNLGIHNWKHLNDYYKNSRITIIAKNLD